MEELEQLTYPTEWFDVLVTDCKAIIARAKIETGIRLLKAKYDMGNRILPDYHKFGRSEHGDKTQRDLGIELGFDRERIGEFIRFAKKINEEYKGWEKAESGDSVATLSWRRIVHDWLPKIKRGPVNPPPIPEGKFNIIYADPPWKYEFSASTRGNPEKHYPVMPLKDICNLPDVKEKLADDSILFLWTTAPKLQESLEVMNAWGFEYRTNMVWVKDRFGTGYYIRGQHEILLIGRKGSLPVPEESNRPSSVFMAKRRKHSEKPIEVYEIIEKMFPNGKYLELFARKKRKGWISWGLELNG